MKSYYLFLDELKPSTMLITFALQAVSFHPFFLEVNDGIGSIYIESRNPKENGRLQNHYHTLKATGTLFLNQNAMQKRLATINNRLLTHIKFYDGILHL